MTAGRALATLWLGPQLGSLHSLCLRSWARHNEDNHLYTLGGVVGVPEGILERNALDVEGVSPLYRPERAAENPSGFSNIFRTKLLQSCDSIWLDTDVLMLAPIGSKYGNTIFGRESASKVNGAVLSLPMESKVLALMSERLERHSGKSIIFGDLGPSMLTKVLEDLEINEEAFPESEFYEIGATEIWKLYAKSAFDEVSYRLKDKTFTHLWNEASKLAPISLAEMKPQEGSFLQRVDTPFWDSIDKREISNLEISNWSENLSRASRRNRLARLIPKPLERGILVALGRRISAGF